MDGRHRKHSMVCKQRREAHEQADAKKRGNGLYLAISDMGARKLAAVKRFLGQAQTEPMAMANCFYANGEAEPMGLSGKA